MSADSFYYYPLELPVDGELELKPTPLVSMPKTIGSVVDHKGRPVAGSTVIAQYKSERDVEVARALIEPCFDDWSWLFGQRDIEVMFSRNGPLSAAAAIDHQWALALIDELFKQHLSDYPSRKLEIISGVILP